MVSSILILILLTIVGILWFKRNGVNLVNNNQHTLNESFLEIINSTKDAFILFDKKGKFTHTNEQGKYFLTHILKIQKANQKNMSFVLERLKELTGIDLPENVQHSKKVELQNVEVSIENLPVKNFYIRIVPIYSKKKNRFNYILIRDITEEIANINKVNEHGYIISEIMTYSRDGYIIIDIDFIVKAINPKALAFLEMDEKSMIGHSLPELFPELENSELITNCEYAQLQQEAMEFDFFLSSQSEWFNIKLQPNKYGLTIFFYDNSLSKLNTCFNEAERKALEDFSRRDISFYQILARSIDSFQELFPGMFCAIYTLNEKENELKYFSSGYSTFLPTVPKSINSDFLGFDFMLKNDLRLEKNNLYFDFISELFSYNSFSTIITKPLFNNNKIHGVMLVYFKHEVKDHGGIVKLLEKMVFFIEKIFNYRSIFRKLEKLSIVSENSHKAYATINIDEQITWSNKSFRNLFNKTREDIHLQTFTEIINSDSTPIDQYLNILDSIHNFSSLNMVFAYSKDRKEPKQLRLSTHTIFSGDEIQLLIEIDDISEQISHEQELHQKREFLKKITDTVPIILFQGRIEKNGRFSLPFISKEIERLETGLTMKSISKNPESIFVLIHPDDLPKIINSIEIAQNNSLPWNVEFRIVTVKHKTIWINGVGVQERTEDGAYVWNGYLENITEKKEKIKELENVNTRFTYASKAVNEVIWEFDLVSKSMTWSDGLTTIFGYSKEFYPTLENLHDYIHPDDFSRYMADLEENFSNKNKELFTAEYRFKKADGNYADVLDRAFILRDEEGNSKRIIGSIKDISETKLFEKRKKELINETQEFERNQFSMELHDGLAQQLVALNLYLSHLENDLTEEQKTRVEFCKRIVLDSLNQTRTLCYNLSPPELSNGLIAGLKSLFDRMNILNGIQFKLEKDESITPEIFENIDIYNIYRIIQEFINNSMKHSHCTEIECTLTKRRNSRAITIIIHDNGVGFDMETVKFGFGIQNMQKRANLAGAIIKVTSTPGKGTNLIIVAS